jgi:GntR family transcriptional regulator/MocR family aminotransferase
VIYLSSLSKAFSPGLRLGYMVADAELISELRALRRLMYRHPPLNNQRMLAEFLAQGHYDAHLRRFREEHGRRRALMQDAVSRRLSSCQHLGSDGSSAFWLKAPAGVDTQKLAWAAAQKSILIESGAQFFFNPAPPGNFMRLGFHAIDADKILPGIEQLAGVLEGG